MTAEPNRVDIERQAMLVALDTMLADAEAASAERIAALAEVVVGLQRRVLLLEGRAAPEQDNSRHAA